MKSKKPGASDEATAEVEALVSIARDPKQPAMARVSAAKEILNLAWGEVPQELTWRCSEAWHCYWLSSN